MGIETYVLETLTKYQLHCPSASLATGEHVAFWEANLPSAQMQKS